MFKQRKFPDEWKIVPGFGFLPKTPGGVSITPKLGNFEYSNFGYLPKFSGNTWYFITAGMAIGTVIFFTQKRFV